MSPTGPLGLIFGRELALGVLSASLAELTPILSLTRFLEHFLASKSMRKPEIEGKTTVSDPKSSPERPELLLMSTRWGSGPGVTQRAANTDRWAFGEDFRSKKSGF